MIKHENFIWDDVNWYAEYDAPIFNDWGCIGDEILQQWCPMSQIAKISHKWMWYLSAPIWD